MKILSRKIAGARTPRDIRRAIVDADGVTCTVDLTAVMGLVVE